MGCTASKVKSAEDVARCRARRRLIKQAVASRHQFAAAHAAYVQALKNAGAAFRQFGETEAQEKLVSAAISSSPSRPAIPPPPPPAFLSPLSSTLLLQEQPPPPPPPPPPVSLSPPSSPSKSPPEAEFFYDVPPVPADAPPPPSPPHGSAWDFLDPFLPPEPPAHLQEERRLKEAKQRHEEETSDEAATAAEREEDESIKKVVGEPSKADLSIIVLPNVPIGRKELAEVLSEVDEVFLRSFECGKQVSQLLEARKVHYDANFVDAKGRGYESHSKRVLQAISWGHRAASKSPMALRVAAEDGMSTDDELGSAGSHASTLDKLLAWERKLSVEVKTAERVRAEYRKKSASLKSLDRNDSNNDDEAVDKARAVVKELQTKIQIALQGVDTAISAINKLKEEELHPQLLRLIEGLMAMWHELHDCHQKQYKVVCDMKAMDRWGAIEPTTNLHRLATVQLESALGVWHLALEKLMSTQREYMHNLTGWLRLSNLKLEMEMKSRSKLSSAPTKSLSSSWTLEMCHEWSLAMDRVPDKVAVEGIKSLETVVHKLVEVQKEEVRRRKKVDALTREVETKSRKLPLNSKKMNKKQQQQQQEAEQEEEDKDDRNKQDTTEDEEEELAASAALFLRKPSVSTKVHSLKQLKQKLEEEKERVSKAVFDTRAMTINSMYTGLPSVFQAMAGFSRICLHAYQALYCTAHNGGILRLTQG